MTEKICDNITIINRPVRKKVGSSVEGFVGDIDCLVNCKQTYFQQQDGSWYDRSKGEYVTLEAVLSDLYSLVARMAREAGYP